MPISMNILTERVYFTVIYTCYIWLERLLNSEHFCYTKSRQIIYASLHGNQQSYIIYANMQIKIRISQDVLHIFLFYKLMFSPSKIK